jgi:hypothetical protein
MTDDPNYRAISPPEEKSRADYSYVERRAELYDLVEQAGHYRNLERSQRDLARRYDVSHTTIRKDLKRIREWKAERLGDDAEAELETLKTKAVDDLLDAGKSDKAYYLMMNHYETLMEAGVKDSAADEVQVDGEMSVVELLSQGDTDE